VEVEELVILLVVVMVVMVEAVEEPLVQPLAVQD
jgi:hypothetical protein